MTAFKFTLIEETPMSRLKRVIGGNVKNGRQFDYIQVDSKTIVYIVESSEKRIYRVATKKKTILPEYDDHADFKTPGQVKRHLESRNESVAA